MAGNGMELFLRYAEGCRRYLEDGGLISDDDRKALDSGGPSYEVLRKVFNVAIPSLEKTAKRMDRDVFDPEVLREFYSGEHNERKFREGELACLAFPAKVAKSDKGRVMLNLEPVNGEFWSASDKDLGVGDWVTVHRLIVVEKITQDFAIKMAARLEALGLSKAYKFPKAAIKYLERLNAGCKGCGGHGKEDFAHKVEGGGEAGGPEERQEKSSVAGKGEAHA